MKKEKVFVVVSRGIHDYEEFCNILIITDNNKTATKVYKEAIKDAKEQFADYKDSNYKILTEREKSKFDIYLEGYSVENSNTIELLEKELEKSQERHPFVLLDKEDQESEKEI